MKAGPLSLVKQLEQSTNEAPVVVLYWTSRCESEANEKWKCKLKKKVGEGCEYKIKEKFISKMKRIGGYSSKKMKSN